MIGTHRLRDGHVEVLGGYRRFGDDGVQVTTQGFLVTAAVRELVHQSSTRGRLRRRI